MGREIQPPTFSSGKGSWSVLAQKMSIPSGSAINAPPGILLSLVSLTVLLVQVLGDEVVKDTLTAAPGDIGEGTHDQRGDDDENHDDEHGNESSSSHCSCPFYVRATFTRLSKG